MAAVVCSGLDNHRVGIFKEIVFRSTGRAAWRRMGYDPANEIRKLHPRRAVKRPGKATGRGTAPTGSLRRRENACCRRRGHDRITPDRITNKLSSIREAEKGSSAVTVLKYVFRNVINEYTSTSGPKTAPGKSIAVDKFLPEPPWFPSLRFFIPITPLK